MSSSTEGGGIRYAKTLHGDDHHLFSFRSGRNGAEGRSPKRLVAKPKALPLWSIPAAIRPCCRLQQTQPSPQAVATPRLHILRGSGTNENSSGCPNITEMLREIVRFGPLPGECHTPPLFVTLIYRRTGLLFSVLATILRTLAFFSSVVRIIIPSLISISIPIRYTFLFRPTHNYQKSIR